MGSDAPTGEHPTAHTSTGEWQSFELRMRKRRTDRLLARARAAYQEGRDEEGRQLLLEIEELNGAALPLAEPEIRLPPAPPPAAEPETPPQIVFCAVADDGLTVFNKESETEDEEWRGGGVNSDPLDLPLYSNLPPVEKRRGRWGPRVAATVAMCAVLFWFGSPRESPPPPAAIAKSQPRPPSPRPTQSDVSATPHTPTPVADEPATTEEMPIRLAVTEVVADAARLDAASPPASPPTVSLAGLGRAEPRATTPEPAADADPVAPAPTPLEMPPPPTVPAAVPLANGPALETVAPSGAAPAPPPVDSIPTPPPSATPMPAATPAETTTPVPAAAAAGVRATLLRYESAYSRLDVDAVSAVWPALDRRALERAFDGLSSQEVSLGSCEVRIVGESAIADCAGSATWTPKVGGRSQKQTRRWQFRLRNVDARWQIVSATVR